MESQNGDGVVGSYGPNDGGYIHARLVAAAKELRLAQELYCQEHYPHGDARVITSGSPFRTAMDALSELDNIYARYANVKPNPELFSTHEPPYEDTVRWSRYKDEKNNIP